MKLKVIIYGMNDLRKRLEELRLIKHQYKVDVEVEVHVGHQEEEE